MGPWARLRKAYEDERDRAKEDILSGRPKSIEAYREALGRYETWVKAIELQSDISGAEEDILAQIATGGDQHG